MSSGAAAAPPIADAGWLGEPGVRAVFAALNRDGEEVRAVGGAVRDALMGRERPAQEVDFATTATPEVVEARAKAAGIKVVPTGREHGTLALVTHGRGYEVTTLREDVLTDGRHALVRFGRDWNHDAARRDFTINALSAEADGTVHDPVGGYPDILARRVRFIGDPDRRVAEDRLRILRFFRFHAELGSGVPDAAGLAAAIRGRRGIADLSAERVGQEMRRLAVAPGAVDTAGVMQDCGILPLVLAGIAFPATLRRLAAFEAAAGTAPAASLRLAALACRIPEDALRITARLRLSNADRDAMVAALAAARRLASPPGTHEARRLLYRLGTAAFAGGAALAVAFGTGDPARWRPAAELARHWPAPAFPIAGADVLAAGIPAGPGVGETLRELEEWWIGEDFRPGRDDLLRRLQQRLAAAQQ